MSVTCAEVDVLVADVNADAGEEGGVDLVLEQHLQQQRQVASSRVESHQVESSHIKSSRVASAHLVLLANELLNRLVDLQRA